SVARLAAREATGLGQRAVCVLGVAGIACIGVEDRAVRVANAAARSLARPLPLLLGAEAPTLAFASRFGLGEGHIHLGHHAALAGVLVDVDAVRVGFGRGERLLVETHHRVVLRAAHAERARGDQLHSRRAGTALLGRHGWLVL